MKEMKAVLAHESRSTLLLLTLQDYLTVQTIIPQSRNCASSAHLMDLATSYVFQMMLFASTQIETSKASSEEVLLVIGLRSLRYISSYGTC